MNDSPPQDRELAGYDATISMRQANLIALLLIPLVWLLLFIPYRWL